MSGTQISLRQADFVRAYLASGGNATQAAVEVGYSPRTATSQASRMLTRVKVIEEIDKAQEAMRAAHKVDLQSVTDQLKAAYDMAETEEQASAMTGAALGLAKLHGLLIDRTEDVTKVSDMTPAERAAELERLQAELDELRRPKLAAG